MIIMLTRNLLQPLPPFLYFFLFVSFLHNTCIYSVAELLVVGRHISHSLNTSIILKHSLSVVFIVAAAALIALSPFYLTTQNLQPTVVPSSLCNITIQLPSISNHYEHNEFVVVYVYEPISLKYFKNTAV